MKKTILMGTFTLLLCLTTAVTGNTAKAWVDKGAGFQQSGIFTYQVIDAEGNVAICDYNTTSEKLVIPNEIDGHKVVRVDVETGTGGRTDEMASCESCYHVKELVIEEGVRELGDYSFYKFAKLEKITLCKNLRLGKAVFDKCNVRKLELDSVNVGHCNFDFCNFDNVTLKGRFGAVEGGFQSCHIKELVIASSLQEYVGDLFFDTEVDKMVVANGIKKLRFAGCQLDDNHVESLVINDPKTRLVLEDEYVPEGEISFGTIYTVPGAKIIKDARANKISYEYKKATKSKVLSTRKKGKKYVTKWSKSKTVIIRKRYRLLTEKWEMSKRKAKTVYQVYGRAGKTGKWKKIKTTGKTSIVSKYKNIKVVPVVNW